jgi:hypothetical protein
MPPILNKPPLKIGDITYEIKDGIIFIERHKRAQYILENLQKNIEKRLEYTEGFSYPVIIFGMDMISMDKASRDFLAGEGAKNTLSRAFVLEKQQGMLQLNFFIETNKQPVPTKIFTAMGPAIEWSKQFRIYAQ